MIDIINIFFIAIFLLCILIIYMLKDNNKKAAELWGLITLTNKRVAEQEKLNEDLSEDFVAHYSTKWVIDCNVIAEQTFSAKGKDLKESLEAISKLKQLADSKQVPTRKEKEYSLTG